MMRSAVSLKIIDLFKDDKYGDLKVERLLKQLLEKNPMDVDLNMRLGILYSNFPWNDYTLSLPYLKKALELAPQDPKVLLVYTELSYLEYTELPEKFLYQLKAIKTDSFEINSMLNYALSWFYEYRNKEEQEQYLCKSIAIYERHVFNYVRLAELYVAKGKIVQAQSLIEKALGNVIRVYIGSGEDHDFTDINEYINEFISGTCITDSVVNCIKNTIPKK